MTDLLDTPEGREAVEAFENAWLLDQGPLKRGRISGFRAALPALERLFRRKHAEEIRSRLEAVMCDRALCGHFLPQEILDTCKEVWP